TVDLRPVMTAQNDGATHLYSVPTIAWDVVRSGRRAGSRGAGGGWRARRRPPGRRVAPYIYRSVVW
uniref:hypothetical protein n=1 Tax=Nocardia brasiliensis TaxID=37326 RepID=UPI002456C65C